MVNKKIDSRILKIISTLTILIGVTSILYLILGIKEGNLEYSLKLRIPKLIGILTTASLTALSTILFQTTTNNRLLTPNVMGLDSFYVFIQTTIIFLLGSDHVFTANKRLNFFICVFLMVLLSYFLFLIMFGKRKSDVILIVLVGIILGTLFSSLSKFMQIMIDPNEYLSLQNKLFASFTNINVDILIFSMIMIFIICIFLFKDLKYLDVMSLGRDHAINLGVEYDELVRKIFIIVAMFTAISTALVGPITFLGLLVANITKQMLNTYKHSYLITVSILISIFTLIFGQFLLERVFKSQTPVSVVINFLGGIYFMYLLLKESKLC